MSCRFEANLTSQPFYCSGLFILGQNLWIVMAVCFDSPGMQNIWMKAREINKVSVTAVCRAFCCL